MPPIPLSARKKPYLLSAFQERRLDISNRAANQNPSKEDLIRRQERFPTWGGCVSTKLATCTAHCLLNTQMLMDLLFWISSCVLHLESHSLAICMYIAGRRFHVGTIEGQKVVVVMCGLAMVCHELHHSQLELLIFSVGFLILLSRSHLTQGVLALSKVCATSDMQHC